MASFASYASDFQDYAKRKLDRVQNEMEYDVRNEDDIDELEAKLSNNVENTKQDFNQQIDSLQHQIKSKRPQPGDPDYTRKKDQYVQFLASAVDGEVSQQQRQRQDGHQAYRNVTTTVIEKQMRHRLPTLVLKLQQSAADNQGRRQGSFSFMKKPHKNDQELDNLLESSIGEFKRELNENIDDFHHHVLSAKPHPSEQQRDPDGYAARMSAYQQFLQLANEIVKHMQQSFTAILNSYRDYIERLWEAIQQGYDVRSLQQQFEEQLRHNMDRHWASVFKRAEDLIREIDMNLRDTHWHATPTKLDQQRYYQ
ncbi:unnamed protein product [Adineta steineri]|uniref:Uncharacterized protein n=1 Tax=Adineta steineri TaxID=433720 RepID=A0A819SSF2_9BILA|nr:unnamed protein product [Adineta steineri]CAF4067359.1 unnamed protein product [Adineta steineri]